MEILAFYYFTVGLIWAIVSHIKGTRVQERQLAEEEALLEHLELRRTVDRAPLVDRQFMIWRFIGALFLWPIRLIVFIVSRF